MNVRICNEMMDMCGEMETNLENWKNEIKEGDSCAEEQRQQIQKEYDAVQDIQAAIAKYFHVRATFNSEFDVIKEETGKKDLLGRAKTKTVVRKK